MLGFQKIFLLVRFFNWISCNKDLKAKISRFFTCFFCLTPLRLECSRIACVKDTETCQDQPWRQQMNTISKNIINSSNDMKIQTSKCHTFSVLLFYQLSLCIHFSREFFHSSYNYETISRSLRVLLYAATHSTKFPKSMLQKIYFCKRMTAPQISRAVNINVKQIQLRPRASSLSFKFGKRYKF